MDPPTVRTTQLATTTLLLCSLTGCYTSTSVAGADTDTDTDTSGSPSAGSSGISTTASTTDGGETSTSEASTADTSLTTTGGSESGLDDSSSSSSSSGGVEDTVVTYPPLPDDTYRSGRYIVEVQQGGPAHDSYVYESRNDVDPNLGVRTFMTDGNHWTSFEHNGAVEITVTLPMRASVETATVRPLRLGIEPTISENQISFELESHENIYLEVDGEELEPLFIFSNPLETDIPDPDDPDVIYFGPGLHDPDESLLDELPDGATVYVAGGAYVRSLISAEHNASDITIRGRGTMSGIHLPWVPEWGSHMLEMPGQLGTGNRIEGITFVDGPKSNFLINGQVDIHNVRLLGWHRNNDGMTVGEGSNVSHLFAKVNDDVVKLYYSDISVNDVVIWQQPPGGAFQLSWNLSRHVSGAHIWDVDIIHTDRTSGSFANRNIVDSVISARNYNGGSTSDFLFENFRIEGQAYQLFGIHLQDGLPGFQAGNGTIDGITFRDFNATSEPIVPSFLNGNGLATSEILDVRFEGLTIAGEHITGPTNADGELVVSEENAISGTVFE